MAKRLTLPPLKLSQGTAKPIEVIRDGTFDLGSRGTLEVTRQHVDGLVDSFAGPGKLCCNYNHSSHEPGPLDGISAGWLQRVFGQENTDPDRYSLMAEVEWTDRAAELIQAREWVYISAELTLDPPVLYGCGLTNVPAIPDMEPVSLSQGDTDEVVRIFTQEFQDLNLIRVDPKVVVAEKGDRFYRIPWSRDPEVTFDTTWQEFDPDHPKKAKVTPMARKEIHPSYRKKASATSEDAFYQLVRQKRAENPRMSQRQAREAILKAQPQYRPLFKPTVTVATEKDANPYQTKFFAEAQDLREQRPELKPVEARGEIRRRHPELFRAAFGATDEARFVGAAEFHTRQGKDLAQAYQLAAQHLPREAQAMSLKNLR